MTLLPAEAYPVAVYSETHYLTPDRIRVVTTETSVQLWIGGLLVGRSLTADDTMIKAAIDAGFLMSQAAERFSAHLRAELDRRDRARTAEPIEAAGCAAERARPYVAPPVATPGEDPSPGAPVWFAPPATGQPAPYQPAPWPLISDTTPAEVGHDL